METYNGKLISVDLEKSTMEFKIQHEFIAKASDYVILHKSDYDKLVSRVNLENTNCAILDRRMFPTSFADKTGKIIREGDYISITETKVMNNHYYNGLAGHNNDPYIEWETTGTVIYLIEWRGDTLTAQKVKEIGEPHPSLSAGFHYLNNCFDSKKYKIEGNKHEGWHLGNYV